MNDDLQKNSLNIGKKENSRVTFSLISGFIVVLVLVSIIAYRAAIDPKQVKADVAAFAQKISGRYSKRGIDVKIEYADIQVQGGIFEKSITLQQPSIAVKGANVDYKIYSDNMKIVPLDSRFDEIVLELSSPVNLIENCNIENCNVENADKKQFSLTAGQPLKANIKINDDGQREYIMLLPLTSAIEVKQGEELRKYDISNNDASFISGVFSEDDADEYSTAISLEELKIVGESSEVNVAAASLSSLENAGEGEFEFSFSQITSNKIPESFGEIDIDFSQKTHRNQDDIKKAHDIEIFSISGNGFDFSLKGRVAFREKELMPIANLNVIVNGASKIFAALGETKYFTPKKKNITVQAIKMISPNWNEFSLSPLQFDIKRDENSPFVIGKVKADELLALVLQQYLQLEEVSEKPELPVAEEPKIDEPKIEEPISDEVESETPALEQPASKSDNNE